MRALLVLAITISLPAFARDASVVRHFKKLHPCPATQKSYGPCPGYIVDHIIALACGGPDDPSNMQWQTVADAKAKDKWERKGCAKNRPINVVN